MTEKQVHARNARWNGPQCMYEDKYNERSFLLSDLLDNGDVTCRACRRMLMGASAPERKMPGQPLRKVPTTAAPISRKYPLKLTLKDTAPWIGTLRVRAPSEAGAYPVYFDARSKDTPPRFIYDLTAMTADQVMQWTGFDLSKP